MTAVNWWKNYFWFFILPEKFLWKISNEEYIILDWLRKKRNTLVHNSLKSYEITQEDCFSIISKSLEYLSKIAWLWG